MEAGDRQDLLGLHLVRDVPSCVEVRDGQTTGLGLRERVSVEGRREAHRREESIRGRRDSVIHRARDAGEARCPTPGRTTNTAMGTNTETRSQTRAASRAPGDAGPSESSAIPLTSRASPNIIQQTAWSTASPRRRRRTEASLRRTDSGRLEGGLMSGPR